MPVPLWMQVVYGGRSFSPQGQQPRTYREDINVTPLSARGAGSPRSVGSSSSKRKRSKKANPITDPEGFRRNLSDQGLTDEQIDRVFKGAKEDSFSPLSPSDWLGVVGSGLHKGLEALDVPRSAVSAGLIEGTDILGSVLDKIPGVNYQPIEGSKNLRQTGISWQDFVQNFQNRVGLADVLEADKDKKVFGVSTKNPVVRTVAGIAGDIALDPLMYVGVGAADEPSKIAHAFRSEEAVAALGKEAADQAAEKVLQKGVNSLTKEELAAVGREGGLHTRIPGQGTIGKLTGVKKLQELIAGGELPREVTLAAKGTKVGDIAAGAASGLRRVSGLNAALRHIGGRAAEKGLAGDLGRLRGAIRGSNDVAGALDASLVVHTAAEARSLSKGFEQGLLHRWKDLRKATLDAGVDTKELLAAVGGAQNKAAEKAPELVSKYREFLADAREQAHTLAGREFIPAQENYVPRVWTDEARQKFGFPQAGRRSKGVESIAKGREYVPGFEFALGKGKAKKLYKLVDPIQSGQSVEEQIAQALSEHGMTQWFKNDALDVMPDYVKKLSKQVQTEYLGQQLIGKGVAEPLWRERNLEEAIVNRKPAPFKQTGLAKPEYTKVTKELRDAQKIVKEYGHASEEAKSLPWDSLYEKAKSVGAKWEPHSYKALNEIMQETGERYAQFGTGAALPEDIVGILHDVGKMSDPSTFPKAMKLHDQLIGLWKKMALLSPGYHWRNEFGGVYMNSLNDVDFGTSLKLEQLIANDPNPEPFFRKGKFLEGVRGKLRAKIPNVDEELWQQGYNEAKRLGVFTGGQSISEIENTRPGISLFGKSRDVSHQIENRLRGAMFLDEYVKSGGDASAAFAKVMKYHFDYDAIGHTEQAIRQYAVPFYTWTRKAVPAMLEMVVRNPGKVNRYFTIKRNIEKLSKAEGIVPQYFNDNFAIRMPWMTQGGNVYVMPDLPLQSLVDATDMGQLAGQVSPLIKTPYEMAAGKQLWKGIPLTDKAGPIPPVIDSVPGVVPALKTLGLIDKGPGGTDVMTQRNAYLVTQLLPQLGQARRLFPTEDKYQDRRMTSWLSFLLGASTRTNTPDEQVSELWNRYYSRKDEQDRNEALGYGRDAAREMAFSS